ncbi:MAG TPA: hypothetical protein IAA19_00580 [Candidatus Olsenella pullistercoris]|uniref:Polysaccharide biosynthesis protein n=1 Tax=Candidatus Olsenella pullistercoris TaxID=2838712 RepID=A0A9D2EWZ3_9ACTN|nr:hypothetical protein [Candidatus Olsenella pullistercoris]
MGSPAGKPLSIRRNMIWNSAGSLTYLGCQWLITVLVVRLSPNYDAAGVLAVAMSVSNLFAPIALYKIRAYQVSDVHEEIPSGVYVGFRFVTIAIAFVVVLVYAVLTCALSALPCVILYLVFRAGDNFIDVLHGIDQQHYRLDYSGISMALRGVLFLVAFSAVLSLTGCLELAVLAMSLVTYPVVFFDVWAAGSLASVRPVFDSGRFALLLRACLPAVIGMFANNLVVTFARQYLGLELGDAALGVYASISTPVVLIQACSNYVYAPLLGVFAERLDQRDEAGFRALLLRVFAAFLLIFVGGSVAFVFCGKWFLGFVFGAGIVQHADLIYAALLSCSITACSAFLSDLLVAMRQMHWNLIGNVVSCVVSAPLTVFLVRAFGMNGTSYSIALSFGVGVAIMLGRVFSCSKRLCRSREQWRDG